MWLCTAFVHGAATLLGSESHMSGHVGGCDCNMFSLSSLLRQMALLMALYQCCECSTTLPAMWTKGATSALVHLLCTWSPGMLMCLTSWTFARTREKRSRCVHVCAQDNWSC